MDDFVHKYWPYLLGGGIAVLGLVWLFFSGSSSSSNTGASNFTYSVGPTDAQIAAGTAQQNQIQADQTAVSLANIQAGSIATLGGDQLSADTTADNDTANIAGAALNTSIVSGQTAANISANNVNAILALADGSGNDTAIDAIGGGTNI
jgi:hypothetical protein